MRSGGRVAGGLVAIAVAACGGPTVHLSTPEPLAVDVTLRVDIYNHAVPAGPTVAPPGDPEARRRQRMTEIQNLKNARLVGENRRGLLSVIDLPAGEYGTYVARTVEAENTDRTALMRRLATERRVPLADIEKEQATLWRERAFPGEWIEVSGEDGTWRWAQATAAAPAAS